MPRLPPAGLTLIGALGFACNSNYIATKSNKVRSCAKQILTQKFDSPGFQIEHQLNWKVDTSSRGIQ